MGNDSRYTRCQNIVTLATRAQVSVGTAESCTGGLVCGALTDIAGSSNAVLGGIVSYAVSVKESVLGVSRRITRDPQIGVVSGECAAAMCEGARRVLGCDVAVSVTGIAGPGGGEPGKPVGTVWFGLTTPEGTSTHLQLFLGDRDQVRNQAVDYALGLIEEYLKNLVGRNHTI